ncbi:hypothetical protein bcCo53_001162 (plasmid) [Borrelia coriaceae]|uniref:Lipoprotein n=1 Tax=Borrelia coriaceae ATCC 43381 TaxID=1408429 RepID=W5SV87_9SPIR|nr:hypothetical protein [Borrelia coriaceae]AHH11129.1 hypothetical protein BCO_0900025 [Borrelia coriaceae ATCC 43381]UPA16994.1 hypothetical protein bcCo53_001162 [Borrelia coriaceae]
MKKFNFVFCMLVLFVVSCESSSYSQFGFVPQFSSTGLSERIALYQASDGSESKEALFNSLKVILRGYKDSFANAKIKFKNVNHKLKIPSEQLQKYLNEYPNRYGDERMKEYLNKYVSRPYKIQEDYVYAGINYDESVIERLNVIMDKLNVNSLSNDSENVVFGLLSNLCNSVMLLESIIDKALSNDNFAQTKQKSEIGQLCWLIDDFLKSRDRFVLNLRDKLLSMNVLAGSQFIMSELKRFFSKDGELTAMVKHLLDKAYILQDLMK